MEHYKKKQSLLFEEECLPNEVRITATGKAHDLTTRATHRLKEHPVEGVIISASGSHVTKAVTVAELLKRRIPGLLQDTQIKYMRVEDIWEPDMEGLDMLKVTRRIPAISLRLVEGKERVVDVEKRSVKCQGEMESDDGRKDVVKTTRRSEGRRRGGRGGGGRGEQEVGRGGGERGEGSRGMKQRGKGRRRPSGGRGVRYGEDRGMDEAKLQLSRTSEQN